MTYLSLYRKWRSQNFDQIIGQEPIIKTLKNAIKHSRLSHAYLFTGPRGTGKTSTARVLAKALNCKDGPTPNPCGKCNICQKIRDGNLVDVIEIDAASNRGIDEIRELRERVAYLPVEGRYKIYIIDEVHMLTSEAFNALLKTLEEPPTHVVFILATTEPQKIPLTISSRCQRLDFRRVPVNIISEHLKNVSKEEKFEIDAQAIKMIARSAEGSVRDALSLLDQVVAFCGNKISLKSVIEVLGAQDDSVLFEFSKMILAQNLPAILNQLENCFISGASVVQLTRELIFHFRNILLAKINSLDLLEISAERLEELKSVAENVSVEKLKSIIQILAQAEIDMKWHPHARVVLEVALIDIIQNIESNNEKNEKPMPKEEPVKKPEKMEMIKEELVEDEKTITPNQDTDLFIKVKQSWNQILEKVKSKTLFGYVSLHEGEPFEINSKGQLVISFRKGFSFHKDRLEDEKIKQLVENVIEEVVSNKVRIKGTVTNKTNAVKGIRETVSVNTVEEMFEGELV